MTTNPILKVVLHGVYDENSHLSKLRGTPHLVQTIWTLVVQYWKRCIYGYAPVDYSIVTDHEEETVKGVAAFDVRHDSIEFPPPTGLNYNMMPFINARRFEDCKLPKDCKPYWEKIISLITHMNYKEINKVCYLTIQESELDPGECQRRPGVHTDRPGVVYSCDGRVENSADDFGKGSFLVESNYIHWGRGFMRRRDYNAGIYFASNIANSARIWNCEIKPDTRGQEVIGKLGDVENLREFFPVESHLIPANQLYWMTDRTPHESLPMKMKCLRQFIRVVMSPVSVWYTDHSTPNPLGVVPDPKLTRIIKGSKFEKNSMKFVS